MVKNQSFLFSLLSIMGMFCIAHSATYERLDSEPTKAPKIVYVDLPFELLDREPTDFEKEQAKSNCIKALKYKARGELEPRSPSDIERSMRLFHIAALYGEPTACTFMARYYEKGLWGIIPNLERAALCRKNIGWWDVSPEVAAAYARAKARAAALAAKESLRQASAIPGEGLHRRGVRGSS
jgi:hypothetical protein